MSEWNDDEIARLRELWTEGASCSEIARVLNRQFDCGRSRNSVISKLNRIGLVRERPSTTAASKQATAQRRKKRNAPSKPKPFSIRLPASSPGPVVSFRAEALPTEDVPPDELYTLTEIEAGDCRWFYGDPLLTARGFCGCAIVPGTPWCPKHFARAFQPRAVFRKPPAGAENPAPSAPASPKLEPVS